jgi:tetratricopeptide (TPR) repeat protein
VESYNRVLAQDPAHAAALNNRGVALTDLGRTAEALADFELALQARPDYAEALNNRGRALAGLGRTGPSDPEAALASFERAIALAPGYAEAHDNKGLLLFELGRFDEAARAIDEAVRLAPAVARYRYHLAEARPPAAGEARLQELKALAAEAGRFPDEDQVLLHYALGHALDHLGDHAGAFRSWSEGARLRRASLAYDEAAELGRMEAVRTAFPADALRRTEAAPSQYGPVPVFIVGLPRSGSTLLEQMLARHPAAAAAGETAAFASAMRTQGVGGPEAGAGLGPEPLHALGGAYMDRLGPPQEARAVVDKRLDNFLNAGLIARALPQARLIHMRRDPRDQCVSCFSKLFGPEVPYSFDLGELGRHYRAYKTLMAHWRHVLPEGVMLEVDYEALVRDPEVQLRRVLEHCGLAWDRRCLDFHLAGRRIATASAAQVRQPLYEEAIGRWRRYEPFLALLLEALGV